MKGIKKHKGLGVFLALVLMFQLSFQTYHVFTSHASSEIHIAETGYHSQVDDSALGCDLCAQFLGQTFFLWFVALLTLSCIAFPSLITGGASKPISETRIIHSLRGPPIAVF